MKRTVYGRAAKGTDYGHGRWRAVTALPPAVTIEGPVPLVGTWHDGHRPETRRTDLLRHGALLPIKGGEAHQRQIIQFWCELTFVVGTQRRSPHIYDCSCWLETYLAAHSEPTEEHQ
jgi:hypothetical protein